MDNIVQINNDLYINLTETIKIVVNGQSYAITIRDGNGETVHYCHPDAPGYAKLTKLLNKAK